jgi:hypothetical protein
VKVGDIVLWRKERLGIVMSEVFDQRPKWKDEHPAVRVLTKHGLTSERGFWTWLLEDIEVISEAR